MSERHDYFHDVCFEVWRRGGNPDRVNMDVMSEYFDQDLSVNRAALHSMERQEPAPEEEYPDEEDDEPYFDGFDPGDDDPGQDGAM
jgi:hypothetical protein